MATQAEVNTRFTAGWLSNISAAGIVAFIHSMRNTYPDAYLADLVTVTPTRVVGTLRSPANDNIAHFQFGVRFADSQRIKRCQRLRSITTPCSSSPTRLTLARAADQFATISSHPSLLIARIQPDGNCDPIQARNPDTLRATASIFKIWIVGAAASGARDSAIAIDDTIALTAIDRAQPDSEGIALEADGTHVSIVDLARFTIGLSPYIATDRLHERLGRARIHGSAWPIRTCRVRC